MIISHRHKFIFIKTRKTAGTSLEFVLANICGPEDVITPNSNREERQRKAEGMKGAQNTAFPYKYYTITDCFNHLRKRKRIKFRNHHRAGFIHRHIPSEIWDGYFKFCFERNPYERYISLYYFLNRKGEIKESMNDFLKWKINRSPKMSSYYTIGGQLAVDKLYRYEDLEESFADICERLNLPSEGLDISSVRAKGTIRKDRRRPEEVLSKEVITKINKKEKDVFDLLGYQMIDPASI